jgi:hypothetical protein
VLSVTSLTSTNLTISWTNGPGYYLEYKNSLSDPYWATVSTGTNSPADNPAVVPILPGRSQFFRLVR